MRIGRFLWKKKKHLWWDHFHEGVRQPAGLGYTLDVTFLYKYSPTDTFLPLFHGATPPLINYRWISGVYFCSENTSQVSRRNDNREDPPIHTHTYTHIPTQTAVTLPEKPALTQDSTLRMVCGCLAKAIGSTVDPARPAPNDPTPSIVCGSLSLSLSVRSSRLHAPGSTAGWMRCCSLL